jgi:hypothetical protein
MPIVDFGRIDSDASQEDILNAIAKIQKGIDYLMQGGLDSKNAREFGGWLVGNTELQSRDKTVGMSTESTGADDIRFWAGDLKEGAPRFKVTEAGIASLVSALFQSAAGYPRVEINSANNLIGAFADPDTYISFLPSFNSVPTLVLVDAGTTKAFLNRGSAAAGTSLGTFDSEPMNLQASGPLNLQPGGNLQINGTNGYSGSISYVKNVVSGAPSFGSITVSKGIITNVT